MSELSLEPFKPEQIPAILSWVPEKQQLRFWSGTYFSFPLTKAQFVEHLGRLERAQYKSLAFSAMTADREMVAFGELCDIRPGESAMLRKIMVRPGKDLRKGYGSACVQALLAVAFSEYRVHRVYLGVFSDNAPAIALYSKLGFKAEGCWREHVKDGDSFFTLNWMSLLRREWRGA